MRLGRAEGRPRDRAGGRQAGRACAVIRLGWTSEWRLARVLKPLEEQRLQRPEADLHRDDPFRRKGSAVNYRFAS